MGERTGQDPGQPGVGWSDLLAALVEEHGTLTAVAWKLIEKGDDVASIERALRRLRGKGQRDGGVWGQRVLRLGLPAAIETRVRWLALYHSPFNDLPLALCKDQLRVWDRPPISESRARVWIQLGHASCALRERVFAAAAVHLGNATGGDDTACLEALLAEAYLASRTGVDAGAIDALVARADALLPATTDPDRACFRARIADHRGYHLNRRGEHAGALAQFDALGDVDTHPFASYRRDAGRAYALWKLGRGGDALALARRACDHAGDGGYARLRAMGLLLVARIADDASALARARAIAERLDDAELRSRCERVASAR